MANTGTDHSLADHITDDLRYKATRIDSICEKKVASQILDVMICPEGSRIKVAVNSMLKALG